MPPSLDSALEDAHKLESIEVAQQHLQAGRNPAKSLLLELGDQESETSPQANAAAGGIWKKRNFESHLIITVTALQVSP